MPAYVLIRETKKERRAPLRACIAAVAGLGLGAATLGGAAYGPALAGGLLGFVPFLAPILEPGHEPRPSESSDHVIRIKADASGHYYVKGSADGVPLDFMIDTGSTPRRRLERNRRTAACRPAELRPSDVHGKRPDTKRADHDSQTHHRTIRGDRHSRCGERRRDRCALAGHELAQPLPINRNSKRRYDAPLLRNESWSM